MSIFVRCHCSSAAVTPIKHECDSKNLTGTFVRLKSLLMEKSMNGAIGIDTNIEVIVVSLTTWEAHHSRRAKPGGCGELPRSLMRQQWPKLRYQFLFYHDETKLMMNKQILSFQMLKFIPKLTLVTACAACYMCTSWGHVTWLFLLGNTCSTTVMSQ